MKEAKDNLILKPIFRETFRSEQEVRKNGWLVSNNTSGGFKDGKVFLAGNSVNVAHNFNILAGTPITFRFKCRIDDVTPASTSYFIDFRKNGGSHYISFATSSTIILPWFSAYTIYINGVNSSDTSEIEGEWVDIIITATPSYDIGYSTLGRYNSGSTNSQINFDLIEIYKGTLTPSEIKNLTDNKWNKELTSIGLQCLNTNLITDGDCNNVPKLYGTSFSAASSKCIVSLDSGSIKMQNNNSTSASEFRAQFNKTPNNLKIGTKYMWSYKYFIPLDSSISSIEFRTDAVTHFNPTFKKGEWVNIKIVSILANNTRAFDFRLTADTNTTDYMLIDDFSIQEFIPNTLIDFDSTNGVLEDKQVGNIVGEQLLPDVSETLLWNKADCTGTTVDYKGQEDVMEVETTGSSTIYVYKSGFNTGKYLVSVNYFIPEETNISTNSRTPFIKMGNTSSTNGFYLSEKGKWATATGIVDMTISGSFFVYRATGDIGDKYYLSKISCTKIREELDVTDVAIKKQGAYFNGSTSKIDTGTDMIGTKPITIMGWIKPHSFGDGVLKNRLIDNGMLYFALGSNNNIGLTSDNATSVVSDTNSIFINKYYFVAATRGIGGTANFYIGDKSTAPALSGSANQDSGTPVAGSTNIFIGNRDFSDRTFDGLIPQLKVVEGILDIDQIAQYWSESLKYIK